MDYSIVLATLVGTLGSIFGMLLYQRGVFKKMAIEQNYNIARFKLGKRYKLKEMEMPKKRNKGLIETLGKLDRDKIGGLLDMLSGGEEDEDTGLVDALQDIVANNPDIVNKFLSGFAQGKQERKPEFPYEE